LAETAFRDLVVFLQSRSWRDVLDILVVAFLAYRLLVLIRGTRAVQLIAGLSVLVFVGLTAKVLRLQLTYYIFNNLAPAMLIGVVILFQPELRRALDRVGRVGFLGRPLAHYSLPLMAKVIDEVTRGAAALSENRTGALIVFERTVGLENYALTGVRLNAEVSSEFIQSIFYPRSPLHDGAAIIRGNQVLAAGCLLPVTDDVTYADRIGTRHRGRARALDGIRRLDRGRFGRDRHHLRGPGRQPPARGRAGRAAADPAQHPAAADRGGLRFPIRPPQDARRHGAICW